MSWLYVSLIDAIAVLKTCITKLKCSAGCVNCPHIATVLYSHRDQDRDKFNERDNTARCR